MTRVTANIMMIVKRLAYFFKKYSTGKYATKPMATTVIAERNAGLLDNPVERYVTPTAKPIPKASIEIGPRPG